MCRVVVLLSGGLCNGKGGGNNYHNDKGKTISSVYLITHYAMKAYYGVEA